MPELARRALLLALVAVVCFGTGAKASWQDTSTASMPVSSGSLVAPTGLGASDGCIVLVAQVTLAWTPTVSTQATGYRVYRKTTGAYSLIATVAGRTSTGYVDTPVALSTTYTYYVQAHLGSWTADSATASATTAALCL